jgi:hypothetical protein
VTRTISLKFEPGKETIAKPELMSAAKDTIDALDRM